MPRLAVVENALVQCSLLDSQYEQKSGVFYILMPNKSSSYLLNVEPSHILFLKTNNIKFDEIIITFTDQNGLPLDIEDKVNFTLYIIKQKTMHYSIGK